MYLRCSSRKHRFRGNVSTFDFSAPFVAARIILPSGDVFPLWTNVGGAETNRPKIPGTEDLQALAFVQEVQVRLDLTTLPQISVQLSPSFEDGMKFLDSPLADGRMTNKLEVQLGYSGGTSDGGVVLSPVYVAALTAPEVTIDVEIQIALKGQGLGNSATFQGGRVVAEPRETRQSVIERLAAGSAKSRRTLTVDFSGIAPGSSQYTKLNEPAGNFAQGGRSDWLALWEMAHLTECIMSIVGADRSGNASQLKWVPRRARFSGPPVKRYRLYHYPAGHFQGDNTIISANNPSDIELPILSFSCNTAAVWNALTYQDTLNHGVVLNDTNPDTVAPSERSVTLEGLAEPVDSGEGAQTLESTDELPDTQLNLPGDPDHPDAVAQASDEVRSGAAMSVQCEIEVLGDPTVIPGDVIALSGLGRRFDNRVYHVFTVTHSIGVGGFSTNLMVHSNTDPTAREGARTPTGQPNTTDVQNEPEYTATSRSAE